MPTILEAAKAFIQKGQSPLPANLGNLFKPLTAASGGPGAGAAGGPPAAGGGWYGSGDDY